MVKIDFSIDEKTEKLLKILSENKRLLDESYKRVIMDKYYRR